MPWTARTDVGPNERCYVGTHFDTDLNRQVFGYAQEYANGTAAYWRHPMAQAKAAPSLAEAQRLAAGWAFPFAVVRIHADGHEEREPGGPYHEGGDDPQYDAMEGARMLASAVLRTARGNLNLKISNVRIYANDRTVLIDHVV